MINKLLALVILFSCSLVSAQTYTRVGETTLGTDGSTINKVGNSTFINHSDGSSETINKIGNSTLTASWIPYSINTRKR
mgnify:CR=1 FL=1